MSFYKLEEIKEALPIPPTPHYSANKVWRTKLDSWSTRALKKHSDVSGLNICNKENFFFHGESE